MNKEQKEIFKNANDTVHGILILAMASCDIHNSIKSTSETKKYRYKLTFEKEKI